MGWVPALCACGEWDVYNGVMAREIVGEERSEKIEVGKWAERGIVVGGVDYWGYAVERGHGEMLSDWGGERFGRLADDGCARYDPFQHHVISWEDLRKCGESQGVDIRPKSQGGNVEVGDLLSIRSGWCAAYARKSVKEREEAALRVHAFGPDDGQRCKFRSLGVPCERGIRDDVVADV